MFHQAHPHDGRPHWIMQWVYRQRQTMDAPRGMSAWVWPMQGSRDAIISWIMLKHSLLDLKTITGYNTSLWWKLSVIRAHDRLCCLGVWLFRCQTWADKNQRNALVCESVGRNADSSPAGDGEVTVVMADSWSALWPLSNSKPEKWDIPMCVLLNPLSTCCHHGGGGGKPSLCQTNEKITFWK